MHCVVYVINLARSVFWLERKLHIHFWTPYWDHSIGRGDCHCMAALGLQWRSTELGSLLPKCWIAASQNPCWRPWNHQKKRALIGRSWWPSTLWLNIVNPERFDEYSFRKTHWDLFPTWKLWWIWNKAIFQHIHGKQDWRRLFSGLNYLRFGLIIKPWCYSMFDSSRFPVKWLRFNIILSECNETKLKINFLLELQIDSGSPKWEKSKI